MAGLVTVDEARKYLGVEGADEPSDDQLNQVIDGLSEKIEINQGRRFINPAASDAVGARTFAHDATAESITIDAVRAITTVEVTATPRADDSWVALDPSLWIAEPLGDVVATRIRFLGATLPAATSGWGALGLAYQGSRFTSWPRQDRAELHQTTWVRVNGKWGYGGDVTTVPARIKLALLMWLENIWKRDQAFFSDNVTRAVITMRMPGDVEELLADPGEATASVEAV